jgi:hypothetical protein
MPDKLELSAWLLSITAVVEREGSALARWSVCADAGIEHMHRESKEKTSRILE